MEFEEENGRKVAQLGVPHGDTLATKHGEHIQRLAV